MNEQDIERINKIKDDKEMLEIVEKIIKLQQQIDCPDHNGMIDALRDALEIAKIEIAFQINNQGSVAVPKAWSEFSDPELYHMLPQYKQGLINHGIAKIGKGEFERLLKVSL